MMRTPVFFLCVLLLAGACLCVLQGNKATDEAKRKLWMKRCFMLATAAGVLFWFFGFDPLPLD